jgi:hypothetical protein
VGGVRNGERGAASLGKIDSSSAREERKLHEGRLAHHS